MGMVRRKASAKYDVVEGIQKIPDALAASGFREYCVTQAAWDRRRQELAVRDGHRCRRCTRRIPLREDGITTGDAAHIRSTGAGGDDSLGNLELKCRSCHQMAHQPKAVPPK